MADKMSKEEAKKEFDRWFNPDDFPSRYLVVYEVSKLIDAIEPEHKKAVLPKSVGEQWDKLVENSRVDDYTTNYESALINLVSGSVYSGYDTLFDWYHSNKSTITDLVNASQYGWVPKSEKLYRVKVYGLDLPALFYRKCDDGTLSFVQGGAGLPGTEFTMGEIKQRHLENCEREEVIDDEQ